MYTQENYIWGLVAYGLGVLLVMPAMFGVTGFIMPWKPLRRLLRIVFITLLLTPVYAYRDTSFLAPAWIVAAFESVRKTSPEGSALALTTLSAALVGAIFAVIAFYVARHFWRKKRETPEKVTYTRAGSPQS